MSLFIVAVFSFWLGSLSVLIFKLIKKYKELSEKVSLFVPEESVEID